MSQYPYLFHHNKLYPILQIRLKSANRSLLTEALIDSGANMSVFSADIADYLEVELEAGKKIYLQGIGGRILGYAHTIKIDIEKKEFKLKVVFSRELFTSFNILGRDNFFNFFRIIFDEENKMFALE